MVFVNNRQKTSKKIIYSSQVQYGNHIRENQRHPRSIYQTSSTIQNLQLRLKHPRQNIDFVRDVTHTDHFAVDNQTWCL